MLTVARRKAILKQKEILGRRPVVNRIEVKGELSLTALHWLQLLERLPSMSLSAADRKVALEMRRRIMKLLTPDTRLGDAIDVKLGTFEHAILQDRVDSLFQIIGNSNVVIPERHVFSSPVQAVGSPSDHSFDEEEAGRMWQ